MNNFAKEEYNTLSSIYDSKWSGYLESTHKVAMDLINPKRGDSILDVSGGTGLLAEKILSKNVPNVKISILDVSGEMLSIAKKRLIGRNVKIIKGDAHSLPFKNNSFSQIVCVSAFHYYKYPHKIINEFKRVLNKNGYVILVDWCNDSFYFKIFNIFMRTFSKSYIKAYTSKEIKQLFISNVFKVEKFVVWNYKLWSLMGFKFVRG